MRTDLNLTRRQFLKASLLATAGASTFPTIVPSSVLGADGTVAPSNRIQVGFIGTGDHGMGWNLPPYMRHPSARVVAVCDVDPKRLDRAKQGKIFHSNATKL